MKNLKNIKNMLLGIAILLIAVVVHLCIVFFDVFVLPGIIAAIGILVVLFGYFCPDE